MIGFIMRKVINLWRETEKVRNPWTPHSSNHGDLDLKGGRGKALSTRYRDYFSTSIFSISTPWNRWIFVIP